MSGTAITDVLSQLDSSIQTYVFSGYAALASSLATPIHLTLVAYVAFVGWMTTQSWSSLSTGNAVKHTVKIAVVALLALHWDFFATMVYDVVTKGPDALSSILVGSQGKDVQTTNAALQAVFNEGVEKANAVWSEGGSSSVCYKIASICISIFNYLSAGFALLEISVAKCGVGLTVVLAPLFSPFLLSESGKGIFMAWLKTLLGFALVPVILTSVMMLMTPILSSGLASIEPQDLDDGLGCLGAFILGSFSCVGLLLKSAQMAASIAGGLSVSSLEAIPGMRMAGKGSSAVWGATKIAGGMGLKAARFGTPNIILEQGGKHGKK